MNYYYSKNSINMKIEYEGKIIKKIEFSDIYKKSNPKVFELEIKRQFDEYYEGKLKKFNLEYNLKGTKFQKKVLKTMKNIPYGKTISYKELAEKSGYPKAYRAVGSVCSHNDLVIIIPCHRVIASDGGVGGFGGDVELKKRLIDLEKGIRDGRP